jgi:hypothetical protein
MGRSDLGAAFGRTEMVLVLVLGTGFNSTVILSPGFSRAKDLSKRRACAKGSRSERSFVGLKPSSG